MAAAIRRQAWTGLRVRNFGGAILRAAGLPVSMRTRITAPASPATFGLRITIAAMTAPSINSPIWCASVGAPGRPASETRPLDFLRHHRLVTDRTVTQPLFENGARSAPAPWPCEGEHAAWLDPPSKIGRHDEVAMVADGAELRSNARAYFADFCIAYSDFLAPGRQNLCCIFQTDQPIRANRT